MAKRNREADSVQIEDDDTEAEVEGGANPDSPPAPVEVSKPDDTPLNSFGETDLVLINRKSIEMQEVLRLEFDQQRALVASILGGNIPAPPIQASPAAAQLIAKAKAAE